MKKLPSSLYSVVNSEKGFTTFSSHERGFSLVELLVVITIIAILAALGTYGYTYFLKLSRDTKRETDLKVIQSALEQYHSDNHHYPPRASITFPPEAQLNNTTGLAGSPTVTKIYLNNTPQDPTSTDVSTNYQYRGYKSATNLTNCIPGQAEECQYYCLYSIMQVSTPANTSCPDQSGYKLEVGPP